MRRSIFFVLAALVAVFVVLLATDVVDLATDQTEGRIELLGIGAIVGLAALGFSGSSSEEPTTGRVAAARKLSEGRIDPADLPQKPGSLLKRPQPTAASPVEGETTDPPAIEIEHIDESEWIDASEWTDESEWTEEIQPEPASTAVEPLPVVEPILDPVDAELQSLIDDDQMREITELVEAADTIETASTTVGERKAAEDIVNLDDLEAAVVSHIVPGAESVEPLARLELRLADYDDDDLKRVVKESEAVVIAEMVRSGQLTSEGELTEKDIASMVFLAYTSEEMLAELRLRKRLDQPGLEATTGSDFAPLKNIE